MDLFKGREVTLLYFKDIKNGEAILNVIRAGKMNAAFINPDYVVSWFQIYSTVNSVLEAEEHNQLKTKSIYGEIVFRLGATSNIAGNLKTFGINKNSKAAIVVIVDCKEGDLQSIKDLVDGELIQYNPENGYNMNLILKHYNIQNKEIQLGKPEVEALEDAIISRISTAYL
uniref:EKC/KEOPS complex subunit cgi121 n=1 Tax=Arcella intermedia TaxID=1963864 RepID=A0A6B2LMS6_9EUKA